MGELPFRGICVFCGSQRGRVPLYENAAQELGRALAAHGVSLVYGGGSIGLMGSVADAALAEGGRVVGVIPRKLARSEVCHRGLSDLHVVDTMHERKALMSKLSDAFVALPGGFGTFEELLEVITWSQLGIQKKPIGLLDVNGYWEHFSALVEHGVEERFIRPRYRRLFVREAGVEALLETLAGLGPQPSVLEDMGLEDV